MVPILADWRSAWTVVDTPFHASSNVSYELLCPQGSSAYSVLKAQDGRGYVLRVEGLGDCLISPSNFRIQADWLDTHPSVLESQVWPRVFGQVHSPVLHSGAVEIGGLAAIFVGRSGHGKSTLCSAFYRDGYTLLNDDTLAFVEQSGKVGIYPVTRTLKLNDDSVDAVFGNAVPRTHQSGLRKTSIALGTVAGDNDEPTQPGAFFFINPVAPRALPELKPLKPTAACMRLLEQRFLFEAEEEDVARRDFGVLSRVATQTPAFELDVPRDFNRLGEVQTLVKCAMQDAAQQMAESSGKIRA